MKAGNIPFTAAQIAIDGWATAYVCEAGAFRLPTTDIRTMIGKVGAR